MEENFQIKKYEEKAECLIQYIMNEARTDKDIKNYLNKLSEEKKKKYKEFSKEELREVLYDKIEQHEKEAWEENEEIYNFALKLNKAIPNKNLTLTKIAEDVGIKQSSLTSYTSGTAEAGISTLAKLANYLDVTADYLLGREKIDKSSKAKLVSMEYTNLSSDAVEKLNTRKQEAEHPLYSAIASYLIENGYFDEIIFLLEKTLIQHEQTKLLYPESDKQQNDFLQSQEYQYTKQLSKIYEDILSPTSTIREMAKKMAEKNFVALESSATDIMYRMSEILDIIQQMNIKE